MQREKFRLRECKELKKVLENTLRKKMYPLNKNRILSKVNRK